MSWDILLINSKSPVDIESEEYPDFISRTDFINKIKTTFPQTDWADPSFGILDSNKLVAEINAGNEEDIGSSVMLHVYGGEDPVGAIVKLCKQHGWQAYDLSTESYLDLKKPSKEGWNNFQAYRGEIEE
jgi:hypothetical protein